MGKRFIKFRVFRAIPTFQSCRSKESSSTIPPNPVPSFLRLSSHSPTHKSSSPPPPKPPRSSIKRHVSSAFITVRRSFSGTRSFPADSRIQSSSSSRFRWVKDSKWHIVAKIPDYNHNNDHSAPPRRKIYTSTTAVNDTQNDIVLFPPLQLNNRRRFRGGEPASRRRRRSFKKIIRISTSSDSGLFSENEDRENDDEGEETDALVSTDCSTPRPSNATQSQCGLPFSGINIKKKHRRRPSFKLEAEEAAPARLSEFMRKMVTPCKGVEGKVRESFAVVKKSEDPYEDFKRSMAEMVVEKQMFEAGELEELLRCFLSLNSVHHHDAIVRAFIEIWDALFSQSF